MAGRPLYLQLAEKLAMDIHNGRYPVGSMLPPEFEIAQTHGISRATARSGLNHLARLGIVSRRAGVGTRVEALAPGADFAASISSLNDLLVFGATTERKVRAIERVTADEDLANLIHAKPGSRWVHVAAIRGVPDSTEPPICWTDSYLDARFEPHLGRLPGYPGLIVELLAEEAGLEVTEVDQRISATLLGYSMAESLSAKSGAPALRIVRRYLSVRSAEVVTVTVHPADRFEYQMALRRTV